MEKLILIDVIFWVCINYCLAFAGLFMVIFPIVFKVWIIPKIEDQIGQGIRYDEWRYPAPLFFWAGWLGYSEVAWGIVYRWYKYKMKKEIFLNSEKAKGFRSQSYDIRNATPFVLMACMLFALAFFLLIIAVVGALIAGKIS